MSNDERECYCGAIIHPSKTGLAVWVHVDTGARPCYPDDDGCMATPLPEVLQQGKGIDPYAKRPSLEQLLGGAL
jgi:hypothetical protein